ncbi:GntR family transcriptional regulator [Curtobacterium sp. Leaf261]|uniref:GntR family transcriptional regulator n=1 Tax=Curtobacterium sp. Leaf261 TaxID=1736311 RepID=UPI0006FC7997|nr:GntR family transcriptional regulator [Curtobacterium sp. Leaf261]KQO61224.1 GntR family transcriptional regulator [Curtobacterium sp. Leaf261]
MLIRVEPNARVSLAEQVAAQIRGGIADGSVVAGERLPAARELAAGLGINMHTVLRAYDALRSEGLIELRRGRGAVVLAGDPAADGSDRTIGLRAAAAALVHQARALGMSANDLATMIKGMER